MAALWVWKMTAMHVDDYGGSGAPVLFLHGWGMHGGMWGGALAELAKQTRVLAVDLPGHGYSVGRDLSRHGGDVRINPDLHALVDQLATQFSGPEPLTVCGWSLGGQLALRWAMQIGRAHV